MSLLGLLVFSWMGLASAQTGCLDAAAVTEIENSLSLQTNDLAQFDRCKPGSRTYALLEALLLIRDMRFTGVDETAGKPFNQNLLHSDFWSYLLTHTSQIADDNDCPGAGVMARVWAKADKGTIYVCDGFYGEAISKFERAETLLHEARHFEGYLHVTCKRGQREGQAGACDDSIGELGSYAVTVEAYTKMIRFGKFSHAENTMMKILALSYANDVFNEPIQAQDLSGFYLLGADRHGYIYSSQGLTQVAALEGGRLISRGAGLAVFPNDKSDAYTVDVFTKELTPAPAMGTFSTDYNAKPPASRPDVIDILNLGYVSASVTAREIAGQLTEDFVDTIVPLPWNATAAYSAEEVGVPERDSIYVTNERQQMFRVQFLPEQKYAITEMPNPVRDFLQVAVFNSARMALATDGEVFVEQQGQMAPFAPLTGRIFLQMTRPFMWDQYFEE